MKEEKIEHKEEIEYSSLSTVDKVVYKALEKFPMELKDDFMIGSACKVYCGDLQFKQPRGANCFSVVYKEDHIGFTDNKLISKMICDRANVLAHEWFERLEIDVLETKRVSAKDVLKELEK